MSSRRVKYTESKIGKILGNLPNATHNEQHLIKVLTLNNQQNLESVLYRLKKGWIVEFQVGPSLFGKEIIIFTNLPESVEKDFDRTIYRQLNYTKNNWEQSAETTNQSLTLPLNRAGTFHYYFIDSNCKKALGSGYFIVDPVLCYGQDEVIPLDCIRCQTVLAKSLGSFDKWEDRLKVSKESGYNMIHFTPLQELGGSNSSYSLKDQLKLNPAFNSINMVVSFDDVKNLTNKLRQEWKMLSLGDVVLNHTANESPWLTSHPECTYNMITAPYLIPAAILDGYLHVFTKEVAAGQFRDHGIPPEIYTEDHLNAIKNYLEEELIPEIRLHEFYTSDVDALAEEFLKKAGGRIPTSHTTDRSEVVLIRGPAPGRNKATVDVELAVGAFNVHRSDTFDEKSRLDLCVEEFKKRLHDLNSVRKHEVSLHLSAAINNCIANMRYFRVQTDGPRIRAVSETFPLVPRYFTGQFVDRNSVETEVLTNGQFIMAHNGWVMNSDPLKNFADSDSNVYLRRELIAWGDSVKLRYGKKYSDCPFLWGHMRKYIEMTASIFDGVRLDNCHSTPLPVAEYLLDCARQIRPDLYVVAELFTNSAVTDNIFVNKLGITSLIREAMSAWDSHELGRLVYRFGGEPVGSFCTMSKGPLMPSIAHALFYDATHDNPSPVEKRTVFDLIPSAALVSMACCATGSSRGYDELVPHHIHVVNETRLYRSWTDVEVSDNSLVNIKTGIISIKKALNMIHKELSEGGYNQVYVDQMNENIIAVTRHNPLTNENVILISYTAFSNPSNGFFKGNVRNLKVEGELSEIFLEAKLLNKDKEKSFSPPSEFKQDQIFINGLTEYEVVMKQNLQLEESEAVRRVSSTDPKVLELEFNDLLPGSIIIIRVRPRAELSSVLEYLGQLQNSLLSYEYSSNIVSVVSGLSLSDLNYALYRCSEEDGEDGMGSYNIPGFGNLVYCGLQGFESLLEEVRIRNDLGHPFCENLRQGDWMLDYVAGRLKAVKGTSKLGLLFENIFNKVRLIPRYLIPRYFDLIVGAVYRLLITRAAFLMSNFVRDGCTFVRHLAMGSVQCVGHIESAPFPPFSPKLMTGNDSRRNVTMCAGLPHFTTGFLRSWGRDTFISLRGLLLLTGRYNEARWHILGYAACLRHGLIPNLLNRGVNARYNCRDAVWWWLYSICCYIDFVPGGGAILKDPVSRIYSNDDSPPMGPGLCDQPLHDVMQEALDVHFKGLTFRERNAGPEIDAHMTDKGFNNRIGVLLETGFIFGGNEFNCGTWMDKMGSDSRTGNRGKPATPRDGSAVELVALSKAVIKKLIEFNNSGIYPYNGVEKVDESGEIVRWSFTEWDSKISKNFEKHFWIPEISFSGEPNSEFIHRRGIYKDSVGASQPWADYQLRCNFLIALVVAPEMANPGNAWKAIKKAEEILLGPLGIRTLDPADWNYNGDYHNDDNSGNPKVAQGFNYHQGPEWLWPIGFFFRAKLHFAKIIGENELKKTVMEVRSHLGNHYKEILSSPWRGLPELTNKNGAFCSDGCRVQAWSMACLLEVLYDLNLYSSE